MANRRHDCAVKLPVKEIYVYMTKILQFAIELIYHQNESGFYARYYITMTTRRKANVNEFCDMTGERADSS